MAIQHILVDIETLGKRENTVVLTLGCVPFTFEDYKPYTALVRDGFYVKFNAKEQIEKYHRSTCKDTIAWWKEQSKEAREAALYPSPDDASMIDGLDAMAQYIKSTKYDWKRSYVWSRGTYFDFPKIEHMYDSVNMPIPYNSWRIRDVRTYIDILTGVDDGRYETKKPLQGFVAHNALHDASRDAYAMQEIFAQSTADDDIPF